MNRYLALGLLVLGTVLGLAGTDLVLPAIPTLPDALGGTPTKAQLVIAAFVAGSALGLLLFGTLGARFGRRNCLIAGLLGYATCSAAAGLAIGMDGLIAWRFLQGIVAAAPAVFAPGIIRGLFDEQGATRAIGALASIESLTPAAAPIVGLWLLSWGSWTTSFFVTAVLAAMLGLTILAMRSALPHTPDAAASGSYLRLLTSPVFLRYALSQACVTGGLLIFVFGAPVVIVRSMDGELADFIRMQVVGISCFIITSNFTGSLAARWGAERVIWFGTAMAALGAAAITAFALVGNGDPFWLALLFAPLNAGLGFRGPPGFLRAIMAGEGDDDRAASLTILAILGVAAGGTAMLAPVVTAGLVPLALACLAVQMTALLGLAVLPRLRMEAA
ncbi:MAG: MFS transporter [Pseudomonadota bacterium]